jgi:hypothetical protein
VNQVQKLMKPFEGPNYHKNVDRGGNRRPCAYCGKEIKQSSSAVPIGVTGGGDRFFNVKDDAAEEKKDPGGYMGGHDLGPDCAKKLKAQQPELFA